MIEITKQSLKNLIIDVIFLNTGNNIVYIFLIFKNKLFIFLIYIKHSSFMQNDLNKENRKKSGIKINMCIIYYWEPTNIYIYIVALCKSLKNK